MLQFVLFNHWHYSHNEPFFSPLYVLLHYSSEVLISSSSSLKMFQWHESLQKQHFKTPSDPREQNTTWQGLVTCVWCKVKSMRPSVHVEEQQGSVHERLVGNTLGTNTASAHVRRLDKDTVAVEDKRLSDLQRDRERNINEAHDSSHCRHLSEVTQL